MTNEKIEILCAVCSVGPEKISRYNDDLYYVEGKPHYVKTGDLTSPSYQFVAQIGPYKVYAQK